MQAALNGRTLSAAQVESYPRKLAVNSCRKSRSGVAPRVPLTQQWQTLDLFVACRSTGSDGAQRASVVTSQSTPDTTAAGPLRVELETAGARRSLKFDVAPMGYGQAIICVEVASGSEAEEAGVCTGLRLTAISDPIRRDEVWKLQDRPSLKNIRELLRMRSADTITLEFVPWDGPMPTNINTLLTSSAGSTSGSALSSLDSTASPTESIGERLQRQYEEAAKSGRAVTAVQQRQQKRKERMEIDSQRDDRPFLLVLLALFVLPPLIILVVAQGTGYLDSLYSNTMIGMR